MKLLTLLALLPTTTLADSHIFHMSERSVMVASETTENDCIMRIDIHNEHTDILNSVRGVIGLDGLSVVATYQLNIGPNAGEWYSFESPEGYIAVPQSLFVEDKHDGYVLICPLDNYIGF